MRLPIEIRLPVSTKGSSNISKDFVFVEDEPVLVELQGTIEIEDEEGQEGDATVIGQLDLSNKVSRALY